MRCPAPAVLSRALVTQIDDDLRVHLGTCPACAAELAAFAAIDDDVSELPVHEPAIDHAHHVRTRLLAAAASTTSPARSRRWWLAGGTAVLATAIALVVVVPRHGGDEPAYRATIHPHAGAELVRIGAAPDEIVRLVRGTITVEVATLLPGERFRVITGDGEVEVRGTAFDVTAVDDHLAGVHVLHGRVEVRGTGSPAVILHAAERWQPRIARADLPAQAPVTADDDDPGPTTDVPATTRGASTRSTKTKRSGSDASKHVAPDARKPTQAPPVSKSLATGKQIVAARKRPIEVLFDQGWAALAAGDPSTAATAFERAANAAPDDPLAEDAWFWRASALARMKSPAAAAALASFLARYPGSPRAGEASAVLGWIVLDADLDRAESLFRVAAADKVSAVRASGDKGLAAVKQKRHNLR